jgi:hypothetical protein
VEKLVGRRPVPGVDPWPELHIEVSQTVSLGYRSADLVATCWLVSSYRMRSEAKTRENVRHATIPVSDTHVLSNQRHVRKGDRLHATVDIMHFSTVER